MSAPVDLGDESESGGGLMVGAIQLSIMLGAAFGGWLLDHLSIAATFVAGTALLVAAALIVGTGERIRPRMTRARGDDSATRLAPCRC